MVVTDHSVAGPLAEETESNEDQKSASITFGSEHVEVRGCGMCVFLDLDRVLNL